MLGSPASSADNNSNFTLVQNSILDIGPFVISGLVPSAGSGLAVSVTAGVASIGARVTAAAPFSIAGLAASNTNHLYLLDTGVGTSNTSGTQPANSTKLGTATTDGSSVTSVNVLRSSGRQTLVRHENLVAGAVGSPGSINLAAWNATAGDTYQVYGMLPGGAFPAMAVAIATKTANYTLTTSDVVILGDATGGSFTLTLPAVAGNTGLVFRIKKIDSSGNSVIVDGNAAETIDGALTAVVNLQYAAIDLICNGSAWHVF